MRSVTAGIASPFYFSITATAYALDGVSGFWGCLIFIESYIPAAVEDCILVWEDSPQLFRYVDGSAHRLLRIIIRSCSGLFFSRSHYIPPLFCHSLLGHREI
jgi:hypothetical protein